MPRLDNPRHERFAQLMVKPKPDGSQISATEAWQIVTGCDRTSADANAWSIMGNEGVKQRIDELNAEIISGSVLSKAESLAFLARVVRTPIGDVDESHPLAQAVKRSPEGNVTEVKMPAKLDALTLNAKLQGWLTERTEHTLKLSIYHAGDEKPVIDV